MGTAVDISSLALPPFSSFWRRVSDEDQGLKRPLPFSSFLALLESVFTDILRGLHFNSRVHLVLGNAALNTTFQRIIRNSGLPPS